MRYKYYTPTLELEMFLLGGEKNELFLVEGCFPIWNCFSEGKVRGPNKHHIYNEFQRQETTCFLSQGTFWKKPSPVITCNTDTMFVFFSGRVDYAKSLKTRHFTHKEISF